ncbi:substrate-binding domain-containing protein [Winkia sp. UMB1185]|uniref:substrate-binding domain-containing protein n=1 Tax=Winkia sp. UMB1185 TaxID=3046324 RepID=UPI0025568895|nr:substrate-binding domain-containing protein [Winkia sp. UMB1185]MDK7229453.1 substrate-binding domain-containing protein [Winkia sp. UMB1185]
MAHKPTLLSLAMDLNVSRQTISNAIHHPERLQADTLARIHAELDRQGYAPSRAARQLRNNRAGAFGYRLHPTFDGINGNILDRFLHELVATAQAAGFSVVVFAANSDEDEIAQLQHLHQTGAIDGAILSASSEGDPRPTALATAGLPGASFGRPWAAPASPYAWVDVDGKAGTAAAVTSLRNAHHDRIGWIGWNPEVGVGHDRYLGYKEALGDLIDPDLQRRYPDSTDAGRRAALELAEAGATAVVCASDSLALGAVTSGAFARGNIFGFDDTPVAAAMEMNSVRQPIEDIARTCFQLALSSLEKNIKPTGTLVKASPVIRTSIER